MPLGIDLRVFLGAYGAEVKPCSDAGRLWLQSAPLPACTRVGEIVCLEGEHVDQLIEDAESHGLFVDFCRE